MNLIIGVIPTCCSGLRSYPFFIDMKYCVYKIINTLNDKYYIGVTSIQRFNNGYYGSGKLIKRAVRKYGTDNFNKMILHEFDDEDRAYERERQIVDDTLVNNDKCYNLIEGGGHPPKLFGEMNPNFGRDQSGENNPMYGKNHSEYTKNKISKSKVGQQLGVPKPDGFGKKVSEARKGMAFSETHRKNLSIANKKRNVKTCPHCGKSSTHNMKRFHFDNCKVVNPDAKSEYKKGNWIGHIKVTDTEGMVTVYESASHITRELGADTMSVLKHAKNCTAYTRGKYKGWKFELIVNKEYEQS